MRDLHLAFGELLVAALGTLLIAVALALASSGPPGGVWSELLMLAGELSTAAAVLGFLIHDRGQRRSRDAALERLLRQQRALSSLGAAMRRDLAFDKLAEVVLDAAQAILPYQAATLALLNDQGDRLEPVATRSYGPRPPVERVEAVSMETDGRASGAAQVAVARSLDANGAILQTPLMGDEERGNGRLTLLSPFPPQAVDSADREAMLALGQQAGTAWENARCGRRSAGIANGRWASGWLELSALDEASGPGGDRPPRGAGRGVGQSDRPGGGERGSLMLLDEASGTLRIEVAQGLSDAVVRTARVPLGEKIAGQVALTGEARPCSRAVSARTCAIPCACRCGSATGDRGANIANKRGLG